MDPLSREKFLEWQGRDPHPTGAGRSILHLQQPAFPHLRFEWHPQSRKVYLVRLGRIDQERGFVPIDPKTPMVGEIIAEHAETHGAAFTFVQTFLRGYREGQTPNLRKPHLEG